MVQIHGATAFAGVCHLVLAGLIILNVKTAYTLVSLNLSLVLIKSKLTESLA